MISFQPAPEIPPLAPGEVQLWRAHLGEATKEEARLLSPDECRRADRFHFTADAQRFIAGRAALRMILGAQLGLDPRDVRFRTGPHGKPELEADTLLRFNLSHSGELMLLALTHGREIGVDLEAMRENVEFEMLSAHYFDPEDAWRIRTLPAAERAGKFYEVWTRTEAQLKAVGIGLADGLKVIAPDRWSLLSLTPAAGYAAALAVEGDDFTLNCWAWPS